MNRIGLVLGVFVFCCVACCGLSFAVENETDYNLFSFSTFWDSPVNETNYSFDFYHDGVIDQRDLLLLMRGWDSKQDQEIVISIPNLPPGAKPLTLVRIPSGSFQMGSPDTERGRRSAESPVHTVHIGYDFYLGKWEVTQAQWQALMGSNPSSGYGVGNDYPVYHVSWNDIRGSNGFIDELNALGQGTFLLPSEAEWEYACRGGTNTRFYFGDSLGCDDYSQDCAAGSLPGNRSDYMWYDYNYNSPTYGTKPVGTKLPNQFGLYDMSGNVLEWCYDDWHGSYTGAPTNGSAWVDSPRGSYRVLRSSGWVSRADTSRSALRGRDNPGLGGSVVGFRVVRTP